ncbi:MAG: glycosyltransferase family 9 protein [Verrucomicrobiae bacterium]|nr:glycosyltransferase family 9 protein [Verrucomicrobiae bacterium]
MRVLIIKLKHIGDSLLLTPTIDAIKAMDPSSEIWVLVREGCQEILAGCVSIDRLLTSAPPKKGDRTLADRLAGLRLATTLLTHRFDYVFELSDGDRGRWLATFARTRNRCTNGGVRPISRGWSRVFNGIAECNWLGMHAVEKDFRTVGEFLPLGEAPPAMRFDPSRTKPWETEADLSDFAFLHTATRWERKEWPADNWIKLAERLLQRVSRLVLSCGPEEREIANTRRLAEQLGDRAIFTEGKLEWSQIAWLLQRARLFVGVDTAAMHLAAACNCPTVAIFGPSVPWVWRPWRVPSEVAAPEDHLTYLGVYDQFNQVAALKTADGPVSRVWEACQRFLDGGRQTRAAGPGSDSDQTDEDHRLNIRV